VARYNNFIGKYFCLEKGYGKSKTLEGVEVMEKEKKVKPSNQAAPENRLLYMDNIRWVMIILVVIMHLNVTYSNMGLWYYKEPAKVDLLSSMIFSIYGLFTQTYFMGLLFFISGYFVPGSYDKKGKVIFIKDRFVRLGIPALVYMLFIHPIAIMLIGAYNPINIQGFLFWYIKYISSFTFIFTSGPLWFAVALLIFSVLYALLRPIFSRNFKQEKTYKMVSVNHIHILIIIAVISIIAFVIRLLYPTGVPLFNNDTGNFMQLGYFSSYIVLFILGTVVYRRKLLEGISYRFGRFWFRITLILGFPLIFTVMILGGALKNPAVLFGGLHWQSMAFSIWESFFCVGMCIGILSIFREKFNTQGWFSRFLSANAFGVYVIHAPMLVGITLLFRNIVIMPILKMLLMAAIILPISFICSHLLRKLPVIKKIF
jgi:glucans biosynthesis protein C